MERKEPSLVPEWLKGAASSATGAAIHFTQQSLHQDSSESLPSQIYRNSAPEFGVKASVGECDNSVPEIAPKREYQSSWLRPGGSGSGRGSSSSSSSVLSRGSNPDRDAFPNVKPSSAFGRGGFHQSNENFDRNGHGTSGKSFPYGDWNMDQASAFSAFNDKDKAQASTYISALRHVSAGKATSYDIESSLKAQSMEALHRVMVDRKKELASESLSAHTDEMHVPSLRPSTTTTLMPTASLESVFSIGRTTDYHAKSSQQSSNSITCVKEATEAMAASSFYRRDVETNSTRSPTPSKLAIGHSCLEELELKQSRQFLPLRTTFPQNKMSSPKEKPKPKVVRPIEVRESPIPKAGQVPSQSSIDPQWAQLQFQHEYSNPVQNELIVRKNNKEAITPAPASIIKLEGSSLVGVLDVAVDPMTTTSQTSGSSTFVRKPRQLFDRRSVPILSTTPNYGTDIGLVQRPKEQTTAVEDKRPCLQAQNRSEFFNTLRRKAAVAVSQNNVRTDALSWEKAEGDCDKDDAEISPSICMTHDDPMKLLERGSTVEDFVCQSCCIDNTGKVSADCDKKGDISEIDSTFGKVESAETLSSMDGSDKVWDVALNFEEEEAFLRTLGWNDNAEEEALTEDEIDTFYQQHGEFLATKFTRLHKRRSEYFVTHLNRRGPVGILSGLTSSEADPTVANVQR